MEKYDVNKDYEDLVRITLDSHEHFIALLNGVFIVRGDLEKQHTWLHVMGLMETWDIMTYDRPIQRSS